MRHDLVSCNGTNLSRKGINGPHIHIYKWWEHNGSNRWQEQSVVPYGG